MRTASAYHKLHQLPCVSSWHNAVVLWFRRCPHTESGKKRMDVIANTTDGFVLAEEDLKLRGEATSSARSSLAYHEFCSRWVVTNYNTLVEAKKAAQAVLAADEWLSAPDVSTWKQVLEYKNQDFEG